MNKEKFNKLMQEVRKEKEYGKQRILINKFFKMRLSLREMEKVSWLLSELDNKI